MAARAAGMAVVGVEPIPLPRVVSEHHGGPDVADDLGDLVADGEIAAEFAVDVPEELAEAVYQAAEVLAELGTSFGQEIQPAVVEVAGETRRLEGSAATQYAEWRKLLREIYETETGLPAAPVGSDVIELADHESHPAE